MFSCSQSIAVYISLSLSVPADFTVSAAARARVEQSQWTITQALCYLLQRSHPQPNLVFARCVRVLTETRSLSQLHEKQKKRFFDDWTGHVEIPSLVFEMNSLCFGGGGGGGAK